MLRPLLDGARLLCDLQFSDSMKRRSMICSTIKREIKSQLYETDIDCYLFGEKLADTLRAAKAISKSGSETILQCTHEYQSGDHHLLHQDVVSGRHRFYHHYYHHHLHLHGHSSSNGQGSSARTNVIRLGMLFRQTCLIL